MRPIIKVQNVSKQYHIGTRSQPYHTLRDAIVNAIRGPFNREKKSQPPNDTIWALKDVSFELERGEILGIIGRNGTGKSTLLKILSRVTEPTTGRIELYGRIGSLLEVGTGFHPELSGRENIYLNGAILGMGRKEIARKFDEIVAFAEVDRFIDTPVKHFSSGMYLRLAFAVAAHLEPEILIVDEVLAVGDARFQGKCVDKMQDFGRHGRTVLFVSHNMPAILRLCPRTIMIDRGRVVMDGPSQEVAAKYLDIGQETPAAREWHSDDAPGDRVVRLRAVRVVGAHGRIADLIDVRDPIHIEIEYDVLEPGKRLSGCIIVTNEEGTCVFSSVDSYTESLYAQDHAFTGTRVTTCEIPGNLMAEGSFRVSAAVFAMLEGTHRHAMASDAVGFRIFDPIEGDSARGIYTGPVAGIMRPKLDWKTEVLETRRKFVDG